MYLFHNSFCKRSAWGATETSYSHQHVSVVHSTHTRTWRLNTFSSLSINIFTFTQTQTVSCHDNPLRVLKKVIRLLFQACFFALFSIESLWKLSLHRLVYLKWISKYKDNTFKFEQLSPLFSPSTELYIILENSSQISLRIRILRRKKNDLSQQFQYGVQ